MQIVNIFIASSCELEEWRFGIGDAVRKWSDEFEPNGFRIKLKCWEDHHPEFTGVRKQDEYNEELIKKSDLFFALFREVCGKYTQEEVRVARSHMPDKLWILKHMGGFNSSEVDAFLTKESLLHTDVATLDDALTFIREKLESHIASLPVLNPLRDAADHKLVYGSVGEDVSGGTARLGNLIRQLDYIAEKNLGLRCNFATEDKASLYQSHYYVALLKDSMSDALSSEIRDAVEHTRSGSNPEVSTVYINRIDKALSFDPKLKSLLESKGVFTEPRDWDRIRFNFLIWLLSKRLLQFDKNSGLNLDGGWVCFLGYKVIPEKNLKLSGTSEAEKLVALLAMITHRTLCSPASDAADSSDPLDLDRLDKDIEGSLLAQDLANKVHKDAAEAQKKILDAINARLSVLERSVENFKEVYELLSRKATLEEKLVEFQLVEATTLLRTMIFSVMLCNTYPEQAAEVQFDEDHQFEKISATADKYGITEPHIEMMRMNYANSLARHKKYDAALAEYRKVVVNLRTMDDGSPIIVRYLPAIYLNFINGLAELGEDDKAVALLNEFEHKMRRWEEEGKLPYSPLVARILVAELKLKLFRSFENKKEVIDQSLLLWQELTESQPYVPEEYWDDLHGFFPICIAAAIIDNPELFIHNIKDADRILHQAEAFFLNNENIAEATRMHFLGEIYHNLGFLPGQQHAREYYAKSLSCRRRLFQLVPNEANEDRVAHTLLNIGATYINGIYDYLTLDVAEEALRVVDRCLEIRERLCDWKYLGPATQVYEARLLKGTVLYYTPGRREEGKTLLLRCLQWSRTYPQNTYNEIIEQEVCRILFQHK